MYFVHRCFCVNRFVQCVMWKIEKKNKNKNRTNRSCYYNNTHLGQCVQQPTYNNYSLESIVCSLQFSCCHHHHHHHHSKRFKQNTKRNEKKNCIHSLELNVPRFHIVHRWLCSCVLARSLERPIATIPRFQHNFPLKIIRHRWAGNRNKSDSDFNSPFTFMVVHTSPSRSLVCMWVSEWVYTTTTTAKSI